ncbi:MAG: hypothetical protein RL205_415, partial [Actinomycetota bacterium]
TVGEVLRPHGLLSEGEYRTGLIDDDGLRARGSLIDGKDAHLRTLA